MHYVWETRCTGAHDVLVPKFAPSLREHNVSFIAGRRFPKPLPELEIRFRGGPTSRLTDDLVVSRRRCLVHSRRLIETLQDAGVTAIDYHACRLVDEADGTVHRTHWAANLLDVVHCIDESASDIERDDEEPNEIWGIHHLRLLEDRLGDSPMFRMGERRNTVIVCEAVKRAVERAGITGVIFLPAEGYREWAGFARDNPRNVIGTHDEDPWGPADGGPGEGPPVPPPSTAALP